MKIEQAQALVGTTPPSLAGIPSALMPIKDIPKNSPPMPLDFINPNANVIQSFPSNYFSMEDLHNELKLYGDESITLTVAVVSYELVYDPQSVQNPTTEHWELCLRFKERREFLVMAKNRAKAFAEIVGSPKFSNWAVIVKEKNVKISLSVGRIKCKEQLCITEPDNSIIDKVNNDLFG